LRETGHTHHAEHPFNPQTHEEEDTDVGFPGPGHYIAEQHWPMKVAMGLLAIGAIFGGLIQIPFVDDLVNVYLRPTFDNSPLYEKVIEEPSDPLTIFGLGLSGVIAIGGIALAWFIWVKRPGTSAALITRLKPLYELSVNKWYFDEIYDAVVLKPGATVGRFAANVFERVVIDGLVSGTVAVVRVGSNVVRGAQDGFLRVYAALLLVGVALVALWFLFQST
jgi:NADH-quinone oxidoreductase subunit L